MKRTLTARDWLVVQLLLNAGLLALVIGAFLIPSKPSPPLNVGPLVPATAEEEKEYQLNRLEWEMRQGRGANIPR